MVAAVGRLADVSGSFNFELPQWAETARDFCRAFVSGGPPSPLTPLPTVWEQLSGSVASHALRSVRMLARWRNGDGDTDWSARPPVADRVWHPWLWQRKSNLAVHHTLCPAKCVLRARLLCTAFGGGLPSHEPMWCRSMPRSPSGPSPSSPPCSKPRSPPRMPTPRHRLA